jgi:hypothetical protein
MQARTNMGTWFRPSFIARVAPALVLCTILILVGPQIASLLDASLHPHLPVGLRLMLKWSKICGLIFVGLSLFFGLRDCKIWASLLVVIFICALFTVIHYSKVARGPYGLLNSQLEVDDSRSTVSV